jgi:hypothetical protein
VRVVVLNERVLSTLELGPVMSCKLSVTGEKG